MDIERKRRHRHVGNSNSLCFGFLQPKPVDRKRVGERCGGDVDVDAATQCIERTILVIGPVPLAVRRQQQRAGYADQPQLGFPQAPPVLCRTRRDPVILRPDRKVHEKRGGAEYHDHDHPRQAPSPAPSTLCRIAPEPDEHA